MTKTAEGWSVQTVDFYKCSHYIYCIMLNLTVNGNQSAWKGIFFFINPF